MIIMVPMIVGVHLGWGLLQNNERFVSKSDRDNLPILKVHPLYILCQLSSYTSSFLGN